MLEAERQAAQGFLLGRAVAQSKPGSL